MATQVWKWTHTGTNEYMYPYPEPRWIVSHNGHGYWRIIGVDGRNGLFDYQKDAMEWAASVDGNEQVEHQTVGPASNG